MIKRRSVLANLTNNKFYDQVYTFERQNLDNVNLVEHPNQIYITDSQSKLRNRYKSLQEPLMFNMQNSIVNKKDFREFESHN
jgi:hypothetical protein